MKRITVIALLSLVSLASCSSSGGSSPPGASSTAPDASAVATSAPPPDASAAAAADASTAAVDGATTTVDGATTAVASLVGRVERTSTQPTHGGKGTVYVAVFDGDPVTNQAGAVVVARTLLTNVDLSDAGAELPYRVDDVPVRSAAYQVIAFLDDANAVSSTDPAPASGDLISLDLAAGISGVPVTTASPGEVTLDLPLNAVMP